MHKAILAHSGNNEGARQTLLLHLARVAVSAKNFAAAFGESDAARTAGLLHDIGKARTAWQERLAALAAGERPTFDEMLHDHKMAGAAFALSKNLRDIALVIAGHHGG